MRIVYGGANSKRMRGMKGAETFSASLTKVVKQIGAVTMQSVTVNDALMTQTTAGESEIGYEVNASYPNLQYDAGNIAIENLTPGICSVSGTTVSWVADGNIALNVTDGRTKKQLTGFISRQMTSIAKNELQQFALGSLSKHVMDQVNSVTNAKSGLPGTSASDPINEINQNLYSSTDHVNSWTRNDSHILSGVDLTGISASRYYGQEGWYGGSCATVISPIHIISAAHWHIEIGRKQYFVDANNNVISRTVVAGILANPNAHDDIWIGLLDSPLPASIKPFKVLPSNYKSYLPNLHITSYLEIPAYLVFNGSGHLHIGKYHESGLTGSLFRPAVGDYLYPLASWYNGGHYGSGSIVFTVINNEPVALFCLFTEGYNGPIIHGNAASINAAMTSLYGSSQYQLQTIDLSLFPVY